MGRVPDRIGEPLGIGEIAGAINDRTGTVIGHQLAVVVAGEGESLKLDPDFRFQPVFGPIGRGAFQGAARTQRQGVAIAAVKIAEDDFCIRLPARTNVGGLPAQRHIRDAFAAFRAGRIKDQVFVVMHRKGRLRKAAFVIAHFGRGQVFAAHDRQMIAEHRAQALRAVGH